MKLVIILFATICLICIFPKETHAEQITLPEQLIVRAILPNPTGSDIEGEWIEIYNNSNSALNISQYQLAIGSNNINLTDLNIELTAKNTLFLVRNKTNFLAKYPGKPAAELSFNLINSSNFLILKNEAQSELKFTYSETDDNEVTYIDLQCQLYFTANETSYLNEFHSQCPQPETKPKPEPTPPLKEPTITPKPTANSNALYTKVNSEYSLPNLNLVTSKITENKKEEKSMLMDTVPIVKIHPASFCYLIALNLALIGVYLEFSNLKPVDKFDQVLNKHLLNIRSHWFFLKRLKS
jgi:hypothetical protein